MTENFRIVLISDTHVGDRIKALEPRLLEAIRMEMPDEIWHAGDVCTPSTIGEFNKIAPTIAVEGNRDWFLKYRLPREITREINGIRFVLTHGHVNIKEWALNYLRLFATGEQVSHIRFQNALAKLYPNADVILYGHTHIQVDEKMGHQRFINPGAGYPEFRNKFHYSFARLDILDTGEVKTLLRSFPAKLK